MPDSIFHSEALRAFKERPFIRSSRARVATALGIVTLVCAFLGLAYNWFSLTFGPSDAVDAVVREYQLTHFYSAFYAMSAICIACYLALLWGGFQVVRRRFPVSSLLTGVWLFEIAYYLVIQLLCRIPGVGPSIGGAMGLANGGLMVQFLLLLPIWGPLVILWLRRSHISPSGSAVG